MEVISIEPHGFCEGVVRALDEAKIARKEHPVARIYVLGLLVHNENVVEELQKDNFFFCDEAVKTLEDWCEEIPEYSIVVYAAHGHAPAIEHIAEERHFLTYDATCRYVHDNATIIANEVHLGNDVIYIGRKNHAEAIASVKISPEKVHLLDSEHPEEDSWKYIDYSSPLVLAQTTMDLDDLAFAQDEIRSIYPSARFAAKRCLATERRQNALISAPHDIDLYVILGSRRSNNTAKLEALAHKNYPNATVVRALDVAELETFDLKGKTKAALASGASTSPVTYNEVLAYLEAL